MLRTGFRALATSLISVGVPQPCDRAKPQSIPSSATKLFDSVDRVAEPDRPSRPSPSGRRCRGAGSEL